jgi:hypothetical protein
VYICEGVCARAWVGVWRPAAAPRRSGGPEHRTLLRPVAVPGAVDPAVARHLLGRAEGCRSDSDGAFVHGGRSGAR